MPKNELNNKLNKLKHVQVYNKIFNMIQDGTYSPGMLFSLLFILISYLILLAIIQFLAYQSQSKIIAIIVLLLFSSHYWQILDGLSL